MGSRRARQVQSIRRICGLALLALPLGLACQSEPLPEHLELLREAEEELAVGRAESALELFRRAYDLAPGGEDALRGMALAQLRLGRPVAALALFDELEQRSADAFDAELAAARCEAFLAAVSAAIDEQRWSEAISLATTSPAAAGCRSEQLGDLEIRAHLAEATRALEADDLATSVEHLQRVLADRPGHPGATLARVDLLVRDGARDDALRLISEALAHHPNDERLIEAAVDLLAEP